MTRPTMISDPATFHRMARLDMLELAGLNADDLRRTVAKHRRLLDAKTKRYFAHEGIVRDEREDDALDVQARAVEAMYALLGVNAPRAAAAAAGVGVEVIVDAQTGVVTVRAIASQ